MTLAQSDNHRSANIAREDQAHDHQSSHSPESVGADDSKRSRSDLSVVEPLPPLRLRHPRRRYVQKLNKPQQHRMSRQKMGGRLLQPYSHGFRRHVQQPRELDSMSDRYPLQMKHRSWWQGAKPVHHRIQHRAHCPCPVTLEQLTAESALRIQHPPLQ
ncbi:unannotated protein [freshwater metagenome]|uniref:Unannotated protein n=1 Tax=freshwater metagenome TaxID=449393 RepID=A0A6J6INX5_9ZZZZ